LPEHRETRNYHWKRDYVTDTFGDVSVTYAAVEQTVDERYCVYCGAWFEEVGVIGALEWMANHDTHEDNRTCLCEYEITPTTCPRHGVLGKE